MVMIAMVIGMAEDSEEAEVVVLCVEEAVATVVEDTEEIEVDLERKEATEEGEEDLIVVHLVEDLTEAEEADEVVDLSLGEIGDLPLTRFICSSSIKQLTSHFRPTTAQSVARLTN